MTKRSIRLGFDTTWTYQQDLERRKETGEWTDLRCKEKIELFCKHCHVSLGMFSPSRAKRKYCNNVCQSLFQRQQAIELGIAGAGAVKSELLHRHGRVCASCGLSEWLEKPIPLDLDHINGNGYDHSLDNCRLICPNCHALTPNYKVKNRGSGRATMVKPRHPFYPTLMDTV